MVDIWLISDTHFGHDNIIRYCGRPFDNAAHMTEAMVERWNAVVRPSHHVYHLGDVAVSQAVLHAVMPRLAGHKRLLLGNHDNHAPIADYARYFDKITLWRPLDFLILSHVPLPRDNFPGKTRVNVHGHIHEKRSPAGPYLNACVEHTDYAPVHLDDYLARARKIVKNEPPDRHRYGCPYDGDDITDPRPADCCCK